MMWKKSVCVIFFLLFKDRYLCSYRIYVLLRKSVMLVVGVGVKFVFHGISGRSRIHFGKTGGGFRDIIASSLLRRFKKCICRLGGVVTSRCRAHIIHHLSHRNIYNFSLFSQFQRFRIYINKSPRLTTIQILSSFRGGKRKFNEISIWSEKESLPYINVYTHGSPVKRNDLWAWRHCSHSQTGRECMMKKFLFN